MLQLVADRLTTAQLQREISVNQKVLTRMLLKPLTAEVRDFVEALTDEIDRLMLLYSLREAWRHHPVVDLRRWTYGDSTPPQKKESA